MHGDPPLDEPVLDDEKQVYAHYWYVVDGKVMQSPATGSVRNFKTATGAKEVRRCDLVGRRMMKGQE